MKMPSSQFPTTRCERSVSVVSSAERRTLVSRRAHTQTHVARQIGGIERGLNDVSHKRLVNERARLESGVLQRGLRRVHRQIRARQSSKLSAKRPKWSALGAHDENTLGRRGHFRALAVPRTGRGCTYAAAVRASLESSDAGELGPDAEGNLDTELNAMGEFGNATGEFDAVPPSCLRGNVDKRDLGKGPQRGQTDLEMEPPIAGDGKGRATPGVKRSRPEVQSRRK